MKAKELLEETIKELEQDEKISVNGGSTLQNLSYAYGAIAGGFSACSFPVGLLQSTPNTGKSGRCTAR